MPLHPALGKAASLSSPAVPAASASPRPSASPAIGMKLVPRRSAPGRARPGRGASSPARTVVTVPTDVSKIDEVHASTIAPMPRSARSPC